MLHPILRNLSKACQCNRVIKVNGGVICKKKLLDNQKGSKMILFQVLITPPTPLCIFQTLDYDIN